MKPEKFSRSKDVLKYSGLAPNTRAENDLYLRFLTDVLNLESLHYGYWEAEAELTLENLKRAQRRFSDHLINYIPGDVERIIDVGCGIGDNAILLGDRGYKVTCISPDRNHQDAFYQINDENIDFFQSSLETFETNRVFDLALMCESSNYFGKDIAFERLARMVRESGWLLSASIFRKGRSLEFMSYHVEDEWIESAKMHGFSVSKREDITRKVLPTLQLGSMVLDTYARPMSRFVTEYLRRSSDWRVKFFSLLFRKHISKINSQISNKYIAHMFNPVLFFEKARYVIYLLKKTVLG